MFLGKLFFNQSSQDAFCKLSGDINPIHSNSVEARKTIAGQCVVHGMHTFLCMLELLIAKTQAAYESYSIKFLKPIFLNEVFFCDWDKKNNILKLTNISNITFVSIKCDIAIDEPFAGNGAEIPLFDNLQSTPEDISIEDLHEGLKFNPYFSIACNDETYFIAETINFLGKYRVFEIIGLSGIIGMQVPGMHSIFSECSFSFASTKSQPICEIKKIDKRFKLLQLQYNGINLDAKLQAFFRPRPMKIDHILEIKKNISSDSSLKNLKVLIIGGSRGLGAWVAKILASQDAEVFVTYHSGEKEANEIAEEINNFSTGKCHYMKLDVEDFHSNQIPTSLDHLYYFATPKIFGKQSDALDQNLLNSFLSIYCNSFYELSKIFIENGGQKILYPSSIAISDPLPELEEYIKGKIAGEEICNQIEKEFNVSVLKPRIKRVLTDQTATILPISSENPFDVAKKLVEQMTSGVGN